MKVINWLTGLVRSWFSDPPPPPPAPVERDIPFAVPSNFCFFVDTLAAEGKWSAVVDVCIEFSPNVNRWLDAVTVKGNPEREKEAREMFAAITKACDVRELGTVPDHMAPWFIATRRLAGLVAA